MEARGFSARVTDEVVRTLAPATATLYMRARDHGIVRPKPHGSAALLAIGPTRFVVTARHLLDGNHAEDELVIVNAMLGVTFTLPWLESIYLKDDRCDVTALIIRDSDLGLFEKMRFLTVADMDIRRRFRGQ